MNTVDNTVGGTYRDGQIVLDRPMNWAQGTRVIVQVQLMSDYGLTEGVWPADGSPEGEAEILRRMATFERLEFTPEDEVTIAAAREESKQFNLEAVRKQMGLQP